MDKIKTKEAAEYIGCAEFSLRQSRHNGSLYGHPTPQYYKLGRSVFYDVATLKKWMNKYCTKHQSTKEYE